MAADSSRKIVLTGAGFTHNFGTPLARDLWAWIFNHPSIQYQPSVRSRLLRDFDFESVYNTVMNDVGGQYSAEEKDAVNKAVQDAYARLDLIVRQYRFGPESPNAINLMGVGGLLRRIPHGLRNAFFFTLNQDLFVERYRPGRMNLIYPGIDQRAHVLRDDKGEWIAYRLPSKEELDEKHSVSSANAVLYVKLHGSQNWMSASGLPQMVIGRGKEEQIRKEPLLNWYSQLFEEALFQRDRRLLIIGYGFGDDHINRVIQESVDQYDLRIHIISPMAAKDCHDWLSKSRYGQGIWRGLAGYYPFSLAQMFPPDRSLPEATRSLFECFHRVTYPPGSRAPE